MNETYIKVKGQWKYLYRAVDTTGKTIDFLFTAKRDAAAALRFFRKAIHHHGEPEVVTIDKSGAISPCLANGVLDGMESMPKSITRPADKVHMVRYADDFVITGNSKELLENIIKPAIAGFLSERGLTLSEEKTAIVSISQGFDFLVFNVRKYGSKLLIKPAKSSIKSFLEVMRQEIKAGIALPTASLIGLLNRKLTELLSPCGSKSHLQ